MTALPPRSLAEKLLTALSRRPRIALALLCLCLWLPMVMSLPPLDRDESRFAQSSKQMLESGDFVDIRLGNEPRYKKPVGIYWLQSATTEIAGFGERDRIWTYRLASLLGGIAAAWLTWWIARGIASAETALLAAALLSSTLLLSAESIIATTDAVLLATTLGAQGVLMRAYTLRKADPSALLSRSLALAGWISLGLSVLVKGPVALGVCAVTVAALFVWDRDARWFAALRPLSGIVAAVLVIAPWAIAIALASHGAFYQQSLGTDFASKLEGGQETHGAPPGYYLALLTLTFWPATLFLIPALRSAIAARAQPAMRFLLAWIGASWVMFEVVPTKLPHYILPVYPALAIATALWLTAPLTGEGRGWRFAGIVQFAIGLAALAVASLLLPARYGSGADVIALAALALAVIAGLAALVLASRNARVSAALAGVLSALLLYAGLADDAGRLTQLWVSPRVATVVAQNRAAGDPPVVAAGFVEPSLVFVLGTKTELAEGAHAGDLSAKQGGLALIEDRERDAYLKELARQGGSARAFGEVSGLNYSHGSHVHITLYRVTAAVTSPK